MSVLVLLVESKTTDIRVRTHQVSSTVDFEEG